MPDRIHAALKNQRFMGLPYPKVLVVDESGGGLKNLVVRLADLEIQAQVVERLSEALDFLTRESFALILVNARYRESDVSDSVAAIQATEQGKMLPLIPVIEGNFKEDIIYEGYDSFSGQHQFKPIQTQAFIKKILMHLEIARSQLEMKQMWESLRRMEQELEEKRNAFEQFISLAERDLHDPLRKIKLFSSRLETGLPDLDRSQKSYLHRVKKSAGKMGEYVQGVLSYFRVLSQPSEWTSLELDSVLVEILNDMDLEIHRKNAQISLESLPSIHGHPRQIKVLFENLLSNALKFRNPERTCKIRILSRSLPDQVEIRIEDNGIGFDPQYTEQVFLPFERLHNPNCYPGSGLGLTTCRTIMTAHRGNLTLEARPGEGVSAILHFPKNV